MPELIVKIGFDELHVNYTSEHETLSAIGPPFSFAREETKQRLIRWYIEEFPLHPHSVFADRARKAESAMERVGVDLFNACLGDRSVRALFDLACDRAAETDLIIDLEKASGALAVPWELLRDPDRRWWVATRFRGLVRATEGYRRDNSPTHSDSNLRILLVVSRPAGRMDVPYQSIAGALINEFFHANGSVQLDLVRPATLEQLISILSDVGDKYHVLHFDGHGNFDPSTPVGSQAELVFEGPSIGDVDPVSGRKLRRVLRDSGIQLVVLNACRSGMTHEEDVHGSIAQQLLADNSQIKAVVAMSYNITVDTARQFISEFYRCVFDGRSVSDAVSIARKEVKDTVGQVRSVRRGDHDWCVPALFAKSSLRLFDSVSEREGESRADDQLNESRLARMRGVPAPPDLLVQQDDVVVEIDRRFCREEVLVLQGLAGSGKTVIASEVARWLTITGSVSGPVIFIDLREMPGFDALVEKMFDLLEVRRPTDHRSVDAGATPVSLLRDTPGLVVWDGFESTSSTDDWSEADRTRLVELIRGFRGSESRLLITSRTRDPLFEGLPDPVLIRGFDAHQTSRIVKLAFDQAGHEFSDLRLEDINDETFQRLVQLANGNVDVIAILARRLAAGMELTSLLDDLHNRDTNALTALTGDRRLFAVFDSGYRQLSRAVRQRLTLISFFRRTLHLGPLMKMGDCQDLPADCRGCDESAWRADMQTASTIGLVEPWGNEYFRVHPSAPAYLCGAMSELTDQQRRAVELHYIAVMNSWAGHIWRQITKQPFVAIQAAGSEEMNLRYALDVAKLHWKVGEAAGVIGALGHYMFQVGRYLELRSILESLLPFVESDTSAARPDHEYSWSIVQSLLGAVADQLDESERARVHFSHANRGLEDVQSQKPQMFEANLGNHFACSLPLDRGRMELHAHNFTEAKKLFQQGLNLSREHGFRLSEAAALRNLGKVCLQTYELAEAEQHLRESLEICRSESDTSTQGEILNLLGIAALRNNDFSNARTLLQEAKNIGQQVMNAEQCAVAAHNLGLAYRKLEQWDEAEKYFRESLILERKMSNWQGYAATLIEIGSIAVERQQYAEADRWYREARGILEDGGDPAKVGQLFLQMGQLARTRERLDEAREYLSSAIAAFERSSDAHGRAGALLELGMLNDADGHLELAETHFKMARENFRRLRDTRHEALCISKLAFVSDEQGDYPGFVGYMKQSVAMLCQTGETDLNGSLLIALGMRAFEADDYRTAAEAFGLCASIHEQAGDFLKAAQPLHELGRALQKVMQFEHAERAYRRSLKISRIAGDLRSQGITYHQLGNVFYLQGRHDEAREFYEQALRIKRKVGDKQSIAITEFQLRNVD